MVTLPPQLAQVNTDNMKKYKKKKKDGKLITWANLPNAKADISLSCTSGD